MTAKMYMKIPRTALFILLMVIYYSNGSVDDADDTVHIMWNVVTITPSGYDVFVYITNKQLYRSIYDGWQLRWTWSADQVIWSAYGATAKRTGMCTGVLIPGRNRYPLSCERSPTMVDLNHFAPKGLRIPNCCRSGYLSTPSVDPSNNTAVFRLMVGNWDNRIDLSYATNPPTNFSLLPDYHCDSPVKVHPKDAGVSVGTLLSWLVKCRYSQPSPPRCCVSLSGFYNSRPFSVECPDNTCGFSDHSTRGDDDKRKSLSSSSLVKHNAHMCPVGVQWHVIKINDEGIWWVRVSVKNYNTELSYTNWVVAIQHPSLDDVIKYDHFNYASAASSQNVTMGLFWGTGGNNIIPPKRGKFALLKLKKPELERLSGSVRGREWTVPTKVYFNGFQCTIPNHTLFMYDDRRRHPKSLHPNELKKWQYVVGLALIITLSVAYLHIMHYRNFVRELQPFN